MFTGMQQEYNMLKEERDEVIRVADRYREEVHHRKDELKMAAEQLDYCQKSLLVAEKEKDQASRERDRVMADLEQAKASIQDKDRALQVAAWEQDASKAEMAAEVAKARSNAVQEHKIGFKDTMDYLFLMRGCR